MSKNTDTFRRCYHAHLSIHIADTYSVREFAVLAGVSVRTAYRYWKLAPKASRTTGGRKGFVRLLKSDRWIEGQIEKIGV